MMDILIYIVGDKSRIYLSNTDLLLSLKKLTYLHQIFIGSVPLLHMTR
jgi:hypothetical protein